MGTLNKWIKKLTTNFRKLANKDSITQYNVILGLISGFLLSIIEFITFFVIPNEAVTFRYIFLISSVVMAMQFVGIFLIYRNNFIPKNQVQKWILNLHPFLIIAIGIAVSGVTRENSDQVASFVLTLFAASFIQLYPLKKRIALFLFALIPFCLMMFFLHGTSWEFFSALRLSLMAVILGYTFSTFQYYSNINRIENFSKLEIDSNQMTENMANLRKVFDELELSHKITEAMMKITMEILKNDRLDDVLQLVLDEAVKLVPKAQAGSILILSGERMEFRAARGYLLEKLQKITLYFKDLFQATLKDIYEPAIIKNLRTFDEKHLSKETFTDFKSHDSMVAKAVLTCSFKYDGKFFGSINLDNFDSEDIFNDSDKYLIAHLAKQLEITIGIHKLYEKAIRPTKYDELTQAFTRKYHKELLAIAFQKAKAEDSSLSLCTFDINLFKEINDTFGHETGDDCLAHFSRIIQSLMTPEMFFSRVGGDEFVLVLPGKKFQESAAFVKTIRETIKANPFVGLDPKHEIRFGCGIASYPDDGTELPDLVRLSDARMYLDKTLVKSMVEMDETTSES